MSRLSALGRHGASIGVKRPWLALAAPFVVFSLVCPALVAGQGLFRSPFGAGGGGVSVSIAVGDLDLNGSIDAIVGFADGAAGLFPNTASDGSLSRCTGQLALSGTPSALLLAPFDGNETNDLVVSDRSHHRLQFFSGFVTGDRCTDLSFVEVPEAGLPTDLNPTALASAFLDPDGHRDLVVANSGLKTTDGSLIVYRGDGQGGFERVSQALPMGGTTDSLFTDIDTRDVAIADLDRDGSLDLLAVNAGSDSVTVFLGNGDATFRRASTTPTGRGPVSLATAFLDEDEHVDLVVAERNDDTVSTFLGRGDGTFAEREAHSVGVFPEGVATADVNGDGLADVLTANRGSFDVSVLFGDGNGELSVARSFVVDEEPLALRVADLGGNKVGEGRIDVLAITASAGVATLVNRGDGTFDAVENLAVDDPPTSVAVADLNGDALPDLIAASASGIVSIFLARASGGFSARQLLSVGGDILAVIAVDLNDDGWIDIAVADRELDGVSVALGVGAGRFGNFDFFSTATQPVAITTGDFDGDGRSDLAVAAGDEHGQVSVLLQLPGGGFRAARNTAVGEEPIAIVSGTFDADGLDDLAVANNASSNVVILQSIGGGSFRQAQLLPSNQLPANPIALALGDFDTDGLDDLAIGGGAVEGVSVIVAFGNGDATFQPVARLRLGALSRSLTARDFTGDQIADLATINQDNQLVVARSSGNRAFRTQSAHRVSRLPISLSAGDFDGDGRYDAATANNAATSRNLSVLWNCARDPGCSETAGSAALRGDANGDQRRSAADLVAVALEVVDQDGRRVEGIGRGSFAGAPGADADGDGQVDARDRIAALRRVFAD